MTFQSGFPILITNTADPSLTCWGAVEADDVPCWDRPNRTGTPVAIGNPRSYSFGGNPNYWFNPAAFAMAAPRSYQPNNNAGGVVSDINDPRFGRVISANGARVIQLAGKLYF